MKKRRVTLSSQSSFFSKTLRKGTPQGNILSPLLCNIALDDGLRCIFPDGVCKIIAYTSYDWEGCLFEVKSSRGCVSCFYELACFEYANSSAVFQRSLPMRIFQCQMTSHWNAFSRRPKEEQTKIHLLAAIFNSYQRTTDDENGIKNRIVEIDNFRVRISCHWNARRTRDSSFF